MKVLFILTSHDQLGNTNYKTGFWIEEFAAPYYKLFDQGAQITLASPKGGLPPIDPNSQIPQYQTPTTRRFAQDTTLQHKLATTLSLSQVSADDYDAVFYPGGHGPLWDLVSDAHSIRLIETFYAQKKPIAAVCHGPAVLIQARDETGQPLVRGKRVTGFTNSEEKALQLTQVVPFLVEDRLKELGSVYSRGSDWQSYIVQDGMLLTGQNPASSEALGEALLKTLQDLEEVKAQASAEKHKNSGKFKKASKKVANFLVTRFRNLQDNF